MMLVLDDVQRVHAPAARRAVELLIERPPEGVRVVLISDPGHGSTGVRPAAPIERATQLDLL
jgi:hypothetical protein